MGWGWGGGGLRVCGVFSEEGGGTSPARRSPPQTGVHTFDPLLLPPGLLFPFTALSSPLFSLGGSLPRTCQPLNVLDGLRMGQFPAFLCL